MRSNQRNIITNETQEVVKDYEELGMNETEGTGTDIAINTELVEKPTETISETLVDAVVSEPLAEANEAVSAGVCVVSETCSNNADTTTQGMNASVSAGGEKKVKKVSTQLAKVSFDFTTMNCEVNSKQFGLESVLAVVNTKKNGSRVAIARSVLDEIGVKGTVQVAYSEAVDGLILGSNLNGTEYYIHKNLYTLVQ